MSEMNAKNYKGYFEIEIDGHLGDRRLRRFEEFQINHLANGRTLISGTFTDQAQLFGMLIQFRDLGLAVLSIHYKQRHHVEYEGDSQ